jgi:hypothetical protein
MTEAKRLETIVKNIKERRTGCTSCHREGILEHGICQNCWLDTWQNNTQCVCGDFKLSHGIAIASVCSECDCGNFNPSVTLTDFKAFYGMTPEEVAAHKVRTDRRDDITKPDTTYTFPARTLNW